VTAAYDVVVIGEPLVQLTARDDLRDGSLLELGFSGDALNCAAAAAAAGASTSLVARVPDDELGDALVARVEQLGVDTALLLRVPGQHGVYLQRSDPGGERQFVYVRGGSAGSQLAPDDVPLDIVRAAGLVVASGITCALSANARAAVGAAAAAARRFVYDPNWRPRLVEASVAAGHLRELAPLAELVTPAWPGETAALLGVDASDPAAACAAVRRLGARAVALTRGAEGVLLDDGAVLHDLPAALPPQVVDQTGAGDVLTGTVAARLSLGDDLLDAVRLGMAAAALSLQGAGGTGHLATFDETRALAESSGSAVVEVRS
jgi:2-dehydro-3-deoxygluconokinase